MNHSTAVYQHESNVRSYCRDCDVVFATGTRATLKDINGQSYIDFFAGAGSLNYGHNNPHLKQDLLHYIQQDGVTTTLDFHSDAKSRFISERERLILKPKACPTSCSSPGPPGPTL